MKQYILNEDNLPPTLPIIFPDSVTSQIEDISNYNRGNDYGLSKLKKHLKWITNHFSNRAIAFGYGSYFTIDDDVTTIIYDMGVGFTFIMIQKDRLLKLYG